MARLIVSVEYALDERKYGCVRRNPLEALTMDEQVVDSDRVLPLEVVLAVAPLEILLDALQVAGERVDELRLDDGLEDREAVPRDPLVVRVELHIRGCHGASIERA